MTDQDGGILGRRWWAGLGVILATVLAIVAIGLQQSKSDTTTPSTQDDAAEVVAPETSEQTPATIESVDDSAANTPVESTPQTPNVLFLKDLDDESFVQTPHWVWESEGAASIAGVTYNNSLVYQFQNCSSCAETLEFIVPAGYQRLTGVFGLSDESRHDETIDGIVYFAIYDTAGNQIAPTQKIEYPQSINVDVNITGQARIRIEMSEGTNYEHFVLGDVALIRA